MPKHIHIHKNKNKNKNKNTNTTNVHIHLNHKRQYVRRKQTVKKEVPTTPTTNPIRTFTPLHQFTNFVPIPGMPLQPPVVGMPVPQYNQMASHPQYPVPSPLVQHNPLVNPLRDISGRNRTIQDVINDRTQLKEMQRKQHEEEIQKRIQEHEEKKKQDRSQTLFEVQTKGNFESLPLFSPFASSAADQEEEEDPFFKSVFKKPLPHEVATYSNYFKKHPSEEEEDEETTLFSSKQRTLSPVEEKSEEEDEPPPPPVLKLKKSLSDEEMKEQLDKIKTLSSEYKQGVGILKEHVIPQPEEEPFVPEFRPTFSSDPSFFDTQLGKTIYTSNRGTYYYFTKDGNKRLVSREDVDRINAQKQSSEQPKVSFSKLESKLDNIINQSPLKQRAISLDKLPGETQEEWAKRMREDTAKKEKIAQEKAKKALDTLQESEQKKETLGEWAKRKKDEKQQPLPEATQVSTPESSAMPIAVATEMKGRTDYNKEENIYLRQSDRDRLQALEAKKSNKTITEEEKTEMTNLKAKRRRNKAAGKTYT